MKLIIAKDKVNHNPADFLRRVGYSHVNDRLATQESFSIRLGREHYPRLHMYFDDLGDQISFNLHLDQKRNSYDGAARHNAEYDGEIVTGEIDRLKGLLGITAGEVVKKNNQPITSVSHGSARETKVDSNIGSGSVLAQLSERNKNELSSAAADDESFITKHWWEFWK